MVGKLLRILRTQSLSRSDRDCRAFRRGANLPPKDKGGMTSCRSRPYLSLFLFLLCLLLRLLWPAYSTTHMHLLIRKHCPIRLYLSLKVSGILYKILVSLQDTISYASGRIAQIACFAFLLTFLTSSFSTSPPPGTPWHIYTNQCRTAVICDRLGPYIWGTLSLVRPKISPPRNRNQDILRFRL